MAWAAAAGALLAVAASGAGCAASDDEGEGGPGAGGASGSSGSSGSSGGSECTSEYSCPRSDACREYRCVSGKCVATNVPEGVAVPQSSSRELECRRVECDGQGNERSVVDKTVLPQRDAPECQKFGCSDEGEAVLLPDDSAEVPEGRAHDCKVAACVGGEVSTRPDLTDLPEDERGDCKAPACTAEGGVSATIDLADVPVDKAGDCRSPSCGANGVPATTPNVSDVPQDSTRDCKKPACLASGNVTSVNDDTDVPADTACQRFTCANGTATPSSINEGQTCSDYGFVCSSGSCNLCPAPDAACTDPGPGKNSPTAGQAFDFGGIGHCDTGGRRFCGALSANESAFYKFRDNGTGTIFCEFDPDISITSTGPVTLCEYFSCPSVTCPSGSTPSTSGGLAGCCVDANSTLAAMRIKACGDANVLVSVKAKPTTACAGYTLRFNL